MLSGSTGSYLEQDNAYQCLMQDLAIHSCAAMCHVVANGNLCRAFGTMEEGMRYCEGQFLEVAQRHGLCRPSSSVLTLEDILELHASVVRTYETLRRPICATCSYWRSSPGIFLLIRAPHAQGIEAVQSPRWQHLPSVDFRNAMRYKHGERLNQPLSTVTLVLIHCGQLDELKFPGA